MDKDKKGILELFMLVRALQAAFYSNLSLICHRLTSAFRHRIVFTIRDFCLIDRPENL